LPPSTALVKCLHKLLCALLELYKKYNGDQLGPVINQITQNLANFQEVLQRGLYDNFDLRDTICGISTLCSFYRITGRGPLALIECIQPIVPGLDDHQLKIQLMTQVLLSCSYYPTFDVKQIITQAISILELVNNPLLECEHFSSSGYHNLI
jgi:hypothetical protein